MKEISMMQNPLAHLHKCQAVCLKSFSSTAGVRSCRRFTRSLWVSKKVQQQDAVASKSFPNCAKLGKLCWHVHFSREYIFQPLIFRGRVSFRGCRHVGTANQSQPLHLMHDKSLSLLHTLTDLFHTACSQTAEVLSSRSCRANVVPFQTCSFLSLTGVDTKMWALLRSQGAKSDSVSIKWFDTGPRPMTRTTFYVRWHRMLKSVMLIRGGGGGPSPKVRAFCSSRWPNMRQRLRIDCLPTLNKPLPIRNRRTRTVCWIWVLPSQGTVLTQDIHLLSATALSLRQFRTPFTSCTSLHSAISFGYEKRAQHPLRYQVSTNNLWASSFWAVSVDKEGTSKASTRSYILSITKSNPDKLKSPWCKTHWLISISVRRFAWSPPALEEEAVNHFSREYIFQPLIFRLGTCFDAAWLWSSGCPCSHLC